MTNKKNVTFVLPSLGAGGAERVMSYVSQNIDKSKFNTTLVITGFEHETYFKIDGIRVMYLNKRRVLKAIPKLFFYLKNERCDVIISAISHLNIVMGLFSILFRKKKFIGREVNVLSVLEKHSNNSKKSLKLPNMLRFSYSKLDKIICQSKDMANDLINNYNISANQIIVINNPITNDFKVKKTPQRSQKHIIQLITVGRLAKQKGHLRILESLKNLKIPFHYTIIGDGPEKENVYQQIKEYNLESQITHIPFTDKVPEYLCRSDIFLQGSYVEGFPNALLESSASGTPVIAYKALGGINEIIEHGINGYIVEDTEDFTQKINLIVNSLQDWKPENISKSVYDKFNKELIIKKYETLLLNV